MRICGFFLLVWCLFGSRLNSAPAAEVPDPNHPQFNFPKPLEEYHDEETWKVRKKNSIPKSPGDGTSSNFEPSFFTSWEKSRRFLALVSAPFYFYCSDERLANPGGLHHQFEPGRTGICRSNHGDG
jgi:hypothetical protein